MRQFTLILATLMAIFLASPAVIAAPEEAKAAEDAKADEKADSTAEAKEEAKVDEKADAKAEEKGTGEAPEGEATEDAPPTDEELMDAGKELIAAAKAGNWALTVSLGIMIILGLARRFNIISKLPSKAMPWVSAAFGILAAIGDALYSGGEITWERIATGFLAGAAASGLWGMIGKHILAKKSDDAPKSDDAKPEEKPEEEKSEDEKPEETEGD